MIKVCIDELKPNYQQAIIHFYDMNSFLSTNAYVLKFEETFRCKTYFNARSSSWDMEFKDEDYTWFLLKWG